MSNYKETIILDLSSSLNNQFINIDSQQNLQVDSFIQIDDLLKKFTLFASKNEIKNDIYYSNNLRRNNNTIFIHGERGAGKTTFLHSILAKYASRDDNNKFISLPLIDPTLVETHQHILVDIVTKLTQLVNHSLICCKNENKYLRFRENLEEMAEGLKLLSLNDENTQYDAAWFLDKAIHKSSRGQSLERHFHNFIDTMASILNCDLFIIAIDDVDTKTTKANEILEVIRCYLTHPKLVILLSGDLKLYSHIVRNSKQKEVASQKISESEEMLVEQLEQQYLLKVLPIEQRINLKKLGDIAEDYNVIVQYRATELKYEIKEQLREILLKSLNINKQHLNSHVDFLLNQPVRTIIQLIKTILEAEHDNRNKEINYSELFKQSLYHGFIGSLMKEQIQLDNISQPSPHINSICLELFKLLYRHGELETGYYSRPDSNYDQFGYNAAKLYLSSTIANISVKQKSGNINISNALKIMLAGGASSNIYLTYVDGNLKENHNFNDYLDYIGLTRNERISSLAAHFSPIILDQYDPSRGKAIKSGVIRTPRRKPSSFDEDLFLSALKNIQNNSTARIPSLESLANKHNNIDWEFIDYIAAKTILISSHYIATTTENRDYISAYGLLASLSELLDDDSNYTVENLIPIQTYIYPTFLSGKNTGDKDFSNETESYNHDKEEDKNESSKENFSNKLENLMHNWINIKVRKNISSILIGKIWARLNYTLGQISEKSLENNLYNKKNNDILLGELFSRYIWGIMNSILIEEYRYSTNKRKLSILSKAQNVNTSADSLIRNINEILKSNISFIDELPITFKLITCPLLWPFFDNALDDGDENHLSSSVNELLKKEISYSQKDENQNTLIKNIHVEFDKITSESNVPTLKISALPIMGCFRKK